MTINAITTRSRVNGKDTTSGKQCIPRLESIRRKERWADPDPKEKRPAVTTTTISAGMRSRKPGPHLCFFFFPLLSSTQPPISELGIAPFDVLRETTLAECEKDGLVCHCSSGEIFLLYTIGLGVFRCAGFLRAGALAFCPHPFLQRHTPYAWVCFGHEILRRTTVAHCRCMRENTFLGH